MSKIYRHNSPIVLESGAILPEVEIAYDTFGTLSRGNSTSTTAPMI